MKQRQESKFFCSKNDSIILQNKLKQICNSEEYTVKSIYFDDENESSFFDKEEGINNRTKYRIRTYNSNQTIFLEKKIKSSHISKKEREIITIDILNKILDKKLTLSDINQKNKLLLEFYSNIKLNNLQKKILVQYDRTAFYDKALDFRITIDSNIKYSINFSSFLDFSKEIDNLNNDFEILEVKQSNGLPTHIENIIKDLNIQRVAFSKYYDTLLTLKERRIYEF